MKLSTAFLAIMIFKVPAIAQQANFGKCNINEMTMTVYPADTTAEAVVLSDIGSASFVDTEYGFRIVFERTTRIKILKRAGLDYASVEIPYYVEFDKLEHVYDIDAYTYNIENNEIKNTRYNGKPFDEKIDEHWYIKKLAISDVREGSVIEYTYKILSPYFFNLHDWEFQRRIPTVYSEYTVKMIPFYEYSYIFQGASKIDVFINEPGNSKRNYLGIEFADNIYTFGMKNIPAFRDEEYITSMNDYLMKIDFQLAVIHHPGGGKTDIITTWPLLIKDLLKMPEFGGYLKAASRSSDEILPSLSLNSKSYIDKVRTITDYVKGNFRWNGNNSKFASKTVKDFLKTKTGNNADINLFLCSLLTSSGLKASPVILSTRDHGKIARDYPFQQFLNYIIVRVKDENSQSILLDATENLAPFGLLPARCINDNGLVINSEQVEWVKLADELDASETDSVYIGFTDNLDSVMVNVFTETTGHKALDYRRSFYADEEGFRNKPFKEDMVVKTEMVTENENTVEAPFRMSYSGFLPSENIGDNLVVTPFPGLIMRTNPLKLNYRTYPVDMVYAETRKMQTVVSIPAGYKVAFSPRPVNVDDALISISYNAELRGNFLEINGSYTFKKSVYQKHEYVALKNYFNNIVQLFNEKIVLVKDI